MFAISKTVLLLHMVNGANTFLKECKTFYIATVEGDKPKLRPFGASMVFENKLYFVTANTKKVFKQLQANPNVSIVACNGSRKWVRIEGAAQFDSRVHVKQKMLEANPILIQNKRYTSAEDPSMEIFFLAGTSIEFN